MLLQRLGNISAFSAILTLGVVLGTQPAHAQDHFVYECLNCPSNWANLDATFEACRIGASQSPINLGYAKPRRLPKLVFDYDYAELETVDKTVNVELEADRGSIRVGDKTYALRQFHFHSLSEHFLFGEQLPLEMHLVHQANDGSLAVVARFIEIGDAFEDLDPVIEAIRSEATKSAGSEHVGRLESDLSAFVPKSKRSFRYSGSTTTPPCTEDVLWIAIGERLSASEEQIEYLRAELRAINHGFDNFRPLQSLNGRPVLTDIRLPYHDDDDG